jgi:hypothetical protein
MAAYTWGDIVQQFIVLIWFITLALQLGSAFSLDYPPYSARVDKIVSDPAGVAACQAQVALGNLGCLSEYYTSRAWTTFEWWIYYFTPILMVAGTFFVALYLRWQKYGAFWFIMVIALGLAFVWLIIAIIVTSVYWANCGDHTACSRARYVYSLGVSISVGVADAWIIFCVMLYIQLLCIIALFFVSIATQACLSRAVGGRDTGLDPLFTEEDARAVRKGNESIEAGIDGSSRPPWLLKDD